MWKPRFYYILKNETTNKKYLGQTTRKDITIYLGSGTYWKNHCKKHGGYNKVNISLIWFKWFTEKNNAERFLKTFERENPNYFLENNNEYCNLVKESTYDSPLRGMMNHVFEKHGNPFSGGEIQRISHKKGCYNNIDYHQLALKSWKNKKDRLKKCLPKMLAGHKRYRKSNKKEFLDICRKGGQAAKLKRSTRIEYQGKIYLGWNELLAETGISKYKFNKYNLGNIIS